MFCFQCEQTAKCTACTNIGVCGKTADVANLQDDLTSALIHLANVAVINDKNTELLINGLFTTITNVNFDADSIKNEVQKIIDLTGNTDFSIDSVWNTNEDIRSLKSLILFGLKGVAAYAHHARVLGYKDSDVDDFFSTKPIHKPTEIPYRLKLQQI